MTTIVRVECFSCGWYAGVSDSSDPRIGDVCDNPGAIARTCARHLDDCPKWTKGHPAFGFVPRWTTYQLAHGEVIQIGWSSEATGFPFDLEAASR